MSTIQLTFSFERQSNGTIVALANEFPVLAVGVDEEEAMEGARDAVRTLQEYLATLTPQERTEVVSRMKAAPSGLNGTKHGAVTLEAVFA